MEAISAVQFDSSATQYAFDAIAQAAPTSASSAAGTLAGVTGSASTGSTGTGSAGVSGTGGHRHHHHHHSMSTALSAASQLLGTSTGDLMSGLQSGQSLDAAAAAKGVPQSSLVNAIAASLQQADPTLSASAAASLATTLASGTAQSQSSTWSTGIQSLPGTLSVTA